MSIDDHLMLSNFLRKNTFPLILKLDEYAESFDVIIDRSDDLPAPDGPMIVRNSPLETFPESRSRTALLVFLSTSDKFFHSSVIFYCVLRKESLMIYDAILVIYNKRLCITYV